MAQLNGTLTSDGTISWYFSGLSQPANTYSQFRVTTSDGKSTTFTSGSTGYTTASSSTTGHACGTTITGTGYATTGGTQYTVGTDSVTTQACPIPPPSGTPSVSATAKAGTQISMSWNSITNATGYKIYANNNAGSGDVYKTSVSGTTVTISVDSEYTLYTVKVVPYNSSGDGSIGSASVRTLDETPPSTSGSITFSNLASDSVTVIMSGAVDSGSGIQGYNLYYGTTSANTLHSTNYGTSPSRVVSGLNANTRYYFEAVAFDNSGNVAATRSNNSVLTLREVPTSPTVSSRLEGGFVIQWGSVVGATNYQINYKLSAGTTWVTGTYGSSTTSTTLNLGTYGVSYDFRVRCSFDSGSTYGEWSGTNTATTNPKSPTLTGSYNGTTATLTVSGMSGTFDGVIIERRSKSNGSLVDSKTIYTNGDYQQWAIISSDVKNYYFRAYSFLNVSTTLYSLSYSDNVEFARPLDWAWATAKVAGQPVNVTAVEWNNFTSRINDFRAYKGLGAYSFTTVFSGNIIRASYINQAISAISNMSPSSSYPLPSTATANTTPITAFYFNRLRDSLNSIT